MRGAVTYLLQVVGVLACQEDSSASADVVFQGHQDVLQVVLRPGVVAVHQQRPQVPHALRDLHGQLSGWCQEAWHGESLGALAALL